MIGKYDLIYTDPSGVSLKQSGENSITAEGFSVLFKHHFCNSSYAADSNMDHWYIGLIEQNTDVNGAVTPTVSNIFQTYRSHQFKPYNGAELVEWAPNAATVVADSTLPHGSKVRIKSPYREIVITDISDSPTIVGFYITNRASLSPPYGTYDVLWCSALFQNPIDVRIGGRIHISYHVDMYVTGG